MSTSAPDLDRRATTLTVTLVVVGAVLGGVVLGLVAMLAGAAWVGVVAGVAAGAGAVAWLIRSAPARLLASVDATPIPAGAEARLRNLVDGLCVSNGLPVPHLATIESEGLNCLGLGLGPSATTLVFTRGLLDGLDLLQLEGVVARQLGQVKSGETRLGTVVAPFAGSFGGLVARVIPERYDLLADMEGVGLTRYPPGLTSALEQTRGNSHVASAPRASSHLWLDDPHPAGGEPSGIAHSPIDERIATLQEL